MACTKCPSEGMPAVRHPPVHRIGFAAVTCRRGDAPTKTATMKTLCLQARRLWRRLSESARVTDARARMPAANTRCSQRSGPGRTAACRAKGIPYCQRRVRPAQIFTVVRAWPGNRIAPNRKPAPVKIWTRSWAVWVTKSPDAPVRGFSVKPNTPMAMKIAPKAIQTERASTMKTCCLRTVQGGSRRAHAAQASAVKASSSGVRMMRFA